MTGNRNAIRSLDALIHVLETGTIEDIERELFAKHRLPDPTIRRDDMECSTFHEYQQMAWRTLPPDLPTRDAFIMAALGLAGEAGEFADLVKKANYHAHAVGVDELSEELGDILWYVAAACGAMGLNMDDIARANIEKLRRRYPDGFDPERSRNREV